MDPCYHPMIGRSIWTVIWCLPTLLTCTRSPEVLLRPDNIPNKAVRVGADNNSVWIDCQNDGDRHRKYDCRVFFATGEEYSSGSYLLLAYTRDDAGKRRMYQRPITVPQSLTYAQFDGTNIFVDSALVLVPHGAVNLNWQKMTQRYVLGEEQSKTAWEEPQRDGLRATCLDTRRPWLPSPRLARNHPRTLDEYCACVVSEVTSSMSYAQYTAASSLDDEPNPAFMTCLPRPSTHAFDPH